MGVEVDKLVGDLVKSLEVACLGDFETEPLKEHSGVQRESPAWQVACLLNRVEDCMGSLVAWRILASLGPCRSWQAAVPGLISIEM